MQMNDIIDGLNSCDCPTGLNTAANYNNASGFGCGFGCWIWILLILFYTNNQGYNNYANGCCCNQPKSCCCGNTGYNNGCASGCGGYLFLLVILFLCGSCGNNNYGGYGFDQGYDALYGCGC